MLRGRILSGAAFRTALTSLAIFILVLVCAVASALWTIRAVMIEELRAQIAEEIVLLREVHATGGVEALTDAVRVLGASGVPQQRIVGVFAPDGTPIAGDLEALPALAGWGTLERSARPSATPRAFQVQVVRLGDVTLAFGHSQRFIERTQSTLILVSTIAGVVIALTVLALGYWSSRAVSLELERMAQSLYRFSRGETEVRIPVTGSSDQISIVARQMNAHLDRLSTLMQTMRNTGVAIAHDLRTPLTRASFSLQEAAASPRVPADAVEQLEAAVSELSGLGHTFDTILRIAQIEASNDVSAFAPFDLSELVREICETYAPVLEEAGLSLSCEDPPPVMIEGDRRMVGQALINLVENALHHCPAGTRVALSVRDEGSVASVEVADDGPGVPPDQIGQIFVPFHQTDPSRGAGSTGLGLALVEAIATRHGGSAAAADAAPGLRLTLRFPVRHPSRGEAWKV